MTGFRRASSCTGASWLRWAVSVAEEDVDDLARHVEGGEQRAEGCPCRTGCGRCSQLWAAWRIASLLQKPEKKTGTPQSASMPTA